MKSRSVLVIASGRTLPDKSTSVEGTDRAVFKFQVSPPQKKKKQKKKKNKKKRIWQLVFAIV